MCSCQHKVAAVPEIGRRGPFESQAGQIHGGVHQQEENGHNAGDGVELPGEKDQLVETGKVRMGGALTLVKMGEMTVLWRLLPPRLCK